MDVRDVSQTFEHPALSVVKASPSFFTLRASGGRYPAVAGVDVKGRGSKGRDASGGAKKRGNIIKGKEVAEKKAFQPGFFCDLADKLFMKRT